MEIILIIIGGIMIYSWIHLGIMTFKKSYHERTNYEKAVTVVAIITAALYVIGTAF